MIALILTESLARELIQENANDRLGQMILDALFPVPAPPNIYQQFFAWVQKNYPDDFTALTASVNDKFPPKLRLIKLFRLYSPHNKEIWEKDVNVNHSGVINKTVSLIFGKTWVDNNIDDLMKELTLYVNR